MPCRIPSMSLSSRSRMDAWKRRWIASGCLLLWACGPNGVSPGPSGSTSRASTRRRRGWPPTALSQDRCVALAGSGSRAVARSSCLRSARPPWQEGIDLGPVGVALAGCPRCRALRGCRRARGRRRPRYASCHMHLPRLHAPEPRTGTPVQASVRRFSDVARTVRSNVAARGGAGLAVGRIIGESGGVWQRLGSGAAGNCANAGSARPRYVGRCGAPSHRRGRAPCRRVGDGGVVGRQASGAVSLRSLLRLVDGLASRQPRKSNSIAVSPRLAAALISLDLAGQPSACAIFE